MGSREGQLGFYKSGGRGSGVMSNLRTMGEEVVRPAGTSWEWEESAVIPLRGTVLERSGVQRGGCEGPWACWV